MGPLTFDLYYLLLIELALLNELALLIELAVSKSKYGYRMLVRFINGF